jgi:hypothetical protein
MYNKIDTNDEGDISMKNVVMHILAVEAGSGNNLWVNNRLEELVEMKREVAHVELGEFLAIIADIMEAGWAVKRVRENERISDQVCLSLISPSPGQDLLHVFEKVDRNRDNFVNRMVGQLLIL